MSNKSAYRLYAVLILLTVLFSFVACGAPQLASSASSSGSDTSIAVESVETEPYVTESDSSMSLLPFVPTVNDESFVLAMG